MKSWLGERVSIYYFVLAFCIGIIIGIVFSNWFKLETFGGYSAIFIVFILGFISLLKKRRVLILGMLISGIVLGGWRGAIVQQNLNNYQELYNQDVVLTGKVVDDITHSNSGGLRFKLHQIRIGGESLQGEVWVSSSDNVELKRSDTVTVQGVLLEGFGGFSASLVRAGIQKIENTSQQDLGLQARDKFAEQTVGIIPEPERSLGIGYLLGMKTALPEDLEKQIQLLGLTHVVVASGYNLTILVAFARRLFVNISKYLSAMVGGFMIFGFILVTGFSPSMSRAGLVAGLSLLAWYYGRKIHPFTLLIVAIAGTLLIRPSYIWGDIGWYLSFTAFFGILVLAPLLHHYFWGMGNKPSAIRELFIATLSAQIMTLPIILFSFGSYSLYALLANLLILPIVPLSMLTTFLVGLTGFLNNNLAELVAIPATICLKYCTFIIEKLSSLPSAMGKFEITIGQVFLLYSVLGVLTIILMIKTKHNFLKDKLIVD